ncbi:MAG TPA: hypothetical protein VGJ84_00115 [Polyangiaceae bacterium]
MRFLFGDAAVGEELRQRQNKLRLMDEFWDAFKKACDVPSVELAERLRWIDQRLWVDSGAHLENSPQSVVVSSDEWHLQPLIQAFIDRARPKLSDWDFSPVRPKLELSEALSAVARGVCLDGARVRLEPAPGRLLNVVVHLANAWSDRDEESAAAVESVVEALIGQRLFETWIDSISVAPLARGGRLRLVGPGSTETESLRKLSLLVDRAVEKARTELGEEPLYLAKDRLSWTVLVASPESADDYPAQEDLQWASTLLPDLVECFLQRAPVCSQRFSRNQEIFCYLKMEKPGATAEELLARRNALEDALDSELFAHQAGACVGNGLGLRYCYIHLALSDLHKGLNIVRETAQRQGVGRRSWILFFDTEWAGEWVEIWPDAPPPPHSDP